jgi:uroporphyrinogen decarboxylase
VRKKSLNKRDIVYSLLDSNPTQNYTPGGFFMHFEPACHIGRAAVEKHLQFFHHTGMDLVKIQYENPVPLDATIKRPEDWANITYYGLDFYENQLNVVKGLVNAAKAEAPVVLTLYSPFMVAGHYAGSGVMEKHLREAPEATRKGLEIVTDSLLKFVRAAIKLGVDGFYHSTQGGETDRFEGSSIFTDIISFYDLVLMEEINDACDFNILHVCDYHAGYNDLSPFADYPGHIVSAPTQVGDKTLTPAEVAALFGNRPFLGGMERKGIIANGRPEEIRETVNEVLRHAPPRFMLGADCTLPDDTSWDNVKTAIDAAHQYQR